MSALRQHVNTQCALSHSTACHPPPPQERKKREAVQRAGKTGDLLAIQAKVSVNDGRCAGVHSGEALVNRTTPEKEWMYQTSGQQETLLGQDMLLGGL